MSLFKTKDLWSTTCGKDEIFDVTSLTNADLNNQGYDHIIVGSHNGYLRIFNPQFDPDATELQGFQPTDVLIETQLPHPILQVSVGRFLSGSKNLQLAILHPRTLSVYSFVILAGSAEHGDQCQLYLAYEHQLKRSGFNMITGSFGGVEGRDFLCIQGLDGTLMFYEQETLALTRALPNFLLPTPIVYVPHTDSFVILNSDWHLESYRYQLIGEDSSRKLAPSWRFNLGESLVQLFYLSVTTTEAAIIAVAERNLYCFRETGTINFCKRLQYTPVCAHAYLKDGSSVMTLVASDTNDLMVYENTTLKWAAQLHVTAVSISLVNLQIVKGSVIILSEEGELQCCFLGTEPSVFVPPPIQGSVSFMSEAEEKLSTLQHEIATLSQQNAVTALEPTQNRPDIKITIKVWPMQETDVACKIDVVLSAMTPVNNIHVVAQTHPPLIIYPNTFFIQDLTDSEEVHCGATVAEGDFIVWDLEMEVVAAYRCSDLTPGVCKNSIILPIFLALELAPPVKETEYKLLLSASQTVMLPTLFPEFGADSWNETGSSETVAGFRYRNNPELAFTIAMVKTQSKYRIETNCVSCLTLPISIITKKLVTKQLTSLQYNIALEELLKEIDHNIGIRNSLRELQDDLKSASEQVRAVEKRFLSKLRDKTPSDIKPLHTLITMTIDEILNTAHKLEEAQNALTYSGFKLGNLVKLTLVLLKMCGAAVEKDVTELSETLSCTEHITERQGWAEVVDIGITYLIRTSLAKSPRDHLIYPLDQPFITKSSRLKKYIVSAIERIAKGQHLKEERAVSPIYEGEEEASRVPSSSKERPRLLARPTIDDDLPEEIRELLENYNSYLP